MQDETIVEDIEGKFRLCYGPR